MKKLCLLLISAALLGGCAGGGEAAPDETASVDCKSLYDECIDSGSFEELTPLDGDYIYNYYGIDPESLSDFAAGESSDVMKSDALIILKADSEEVRSELVHTLENCRDGKAEEVKTYNPQEYDKTAAGIVEESGDIVYMAICEDTSAVKDIITGK